MPDIFVLPQILTFGQAFFTAFNCSLCTAPPAACCKVQYTANTVDITLIYKDGSEVEMPTGFDDFSTMADRDYSDCTPSAAEHALYLENIMIEYGFKPYQGEWWHFSDTDSYDVEKEFCPKKGVLQNN